VGRHKNASTNDAKTQVKYSQIRKDFLRNPDLSAEEKVIGCLYASYRDPNWMAWPGLARLMRESKCGRDRVKASKKKLVEKGYLRLERQKADSGRFAGAKFEVTEAILVRHGTET